MAIENTRTGEIADVSALRLSANGGPPVRENDRVVVEQPVTITIDDVGSYTIMCTPRDVMAFAVGFAFSEGLVAGMQDFDLIHCCDDDPSAVRMRLAHVPETLSQRNLIVTSSCGMCGSMSVEETLAALPTCGDTLRVSLATVLDVFGNMKSMQHVFEQTGGSHAVAIFAPDGEIIAFAEDVGRHNAFDKAVGKCLLAETVARGCGAVLSGRVSLELVTKAARAGIELVAAVSAPTSLAIEAAEKCNITLCGFVRGDRATIYCHESRVAI